ncbi:TPA: hypothetical protein ACH3X1_006751 [Trebouxia sp. C0004]
MAYTTPGDVSTLQQKLGNSEDMLQLFHRALGIALGAPTACNFAELPKTPTGTVKVATGLGLAHQLHRGSSLEGITLHGGDSHFHCVKIKGPGKDTWYAQLLLLFSYADADGLDHDVAFVRWFKAFTRRPKHAIGCKLQPMRWEDITIQISENQQGRGTAQAGSTLDLCRTTPDADLHVPASKRGLVDSQSGKTKRRFADIQQDVLHDGLAGSKTRPLQISGAPIAGQGSVRPMDSIASDRQVAQQLLMIPLQQEPPNAVAFGHFLFNAQFQLPVSARPFQLVKAHDPELADSLYQCGVAGTTEQNTTRWVMTCLRVLEEVDAANPDGIAVLLRRNSSEKDVSYTVSKSASGKGAARVDTVANAFRLSLFFGEDKVLKHQGLEQSILERFGDQVERVGRILNVTRLSDRIWLCQALVNTVKYLTLSVTRAPGLTERVTFYQPMERPHATRITLNGDAAVKEISNSDAFYSQFGNSFKAIKAAHLHAQSCGALVHHSSVEEFGVRKRGPDRTSTKKLRVTSYFRSG